jgi:hypothetical protein
MRGSGPLSIELPPSYLAEWSSRNFATYTVRLLRELVPPNGWCNVRETVVL